MPLTLIREIFEDSEMVPDKKGKRMWQTGSRILTESSPACGAFLGPAVSDEPFKPVFGYFADRADPGGLFAGTEIATDFAAPDREGKNRNRAG